MLHFHPLRAGLLALALAGCTTAPPGPLSDDHPASVRAPVAPVEHGPSALAGYRDFGAAAPAPPAADAASTDQSPHQHGQAGNQEGRDATPR